MGGENKAGFDPIRKIGILSTYGIDLLLCKSFFGSEAFMENCPKDKTK
jgi:hypothetical protein